MAYDVETRPATFASARARTHTRRALALVAAFVGVGAVPLVLTQAFEVPLVASAMIVTLMVALYHAADGQSALMERWLKGSAAEAAVGETLETLRWERYIVMHDVPQRGEGNIDHLVVCLATRETRSHRRDGVWVVSRTELADWIRAQSNEPVAFDRLAQFAESL